MGQIYSHCHQHACIKCCCDGSCSSSAEEDGSTKLGGRVPGHQGCHAGTWWDSGLHSAPLEMSLEKGLSCFPSPKIAFYGL